MKRFWLFLFAFAVFASAQQISTSPQYWVETVSSPTIATLPDYTFNFGNSTSVTYANATGAIGDFSATTDAGSTFYPYNTTGYNLTGSNGELLLSSVMVELRTTGATSTTWEVRTTNPPQGCNGTTLASGTISGITGSNALYQVNPNVVLQVGVQYCFFVGSFASGVVRTNNNQTFAGGRKSTAAGGAFWIDLGAAAINANYTFSEVIAVRSPKLTANTSSGFVNFSSNNFSTGVNAVFWSNGSGQMGVAYPVNSMHLNELWAVSFSGIQPTSASDGFYYPYATSPNAVFNYSSFRPPTGYSFTDCELRANTHDFNQGDFITGMANGKVFLNNTAVTNTSAVNLSQVIGASDNYVINFTLHTPNPAISYARFLENGAFQLNCTLVNSSVLSLPILVNGANNLSASASNGSNNYTVATPQNSNATANVGYVNWSPWENQNSTFIYNATNSSFLQVFGTGFVNGISRPSGLPFNVSTISGFSSTLPVWIVWSNTQTVNISYTSLQVFAVSNALMNCSFLSGTVGLNFSTYFENNQSSTVASQAAAFNWTVLGQAGLGSGGFSEDGQRNLSLCVYPSNAQLQVTGTLQYYNDSTKTRNYYLVNGTVNSSTANIQLLVPDVGAQLVLVTVRDTVGNPQPGKYVSFQRQFLALNDYLEVAKVLTGVGGTATTWLLPNSPVYNILVYSGDGTLEASFLQQSINCDPLVSLCSLTIYLPTENPSLAYEVRGKTSWSCQTTNTTVNCTVIDTSGIPVNLTLVLNNQGALLSSEVCRTFLTSASGALGCAVPSWSAQNTYSYALWATFNTTLTQPLESGFLPKIVVPVFGQDGLLIVLFVTMLMVLVGAWNSIIAIGFGVLVLIVSLGIGILPESAYGAVLGFVVMAIMFAVKMR